MDSKKNLNNALTSRIFELFDTGEEAIQFLNANGLEENQYLLRDMEALSAAIASAIEQLSPEIMLKNKLKEIGMNAPLTVSRIFRSLDTADMENAYMQYACAFVPLFVFWRRYAEFFLIHAVNEASLKSWYEKENAHIRQVRETLKKTEPGKFRYDFSVLVLFYGNQKITEECLASIEIYTKGHSYELITFDNGSDPETTAWCESLPHKKKIYYPHNMGSSAAGNLIFTTAPYYMEGKYLLYVSNDVIVTPRYDEILWDCMESDGRIAMAAPVCNAASNLQAIPVPYPKNDLKVMFSFAEKYNLRDPRKWEDRARLFPILGCYRPRALQQMRLAVDPFFCYDMFADDGHSLTLRRMGYRQVLCRDVFVHHYGSATIGEEQFQVMDIGRKQFYQKYGVDAWDSLGTELCTAIDRLSFPSARYIRILAINPLFGEGVLALCNRVRACGCDNVSVDALTEDTRYLDDMEGLFRRNGHLDNAEQALEGQYDIALIGSELNRCRDLRACLHTAVKWLKPGGLLITQHKNHFNLAALHALLQGSAPDNDIFLHDAFGNPVLSVITDSALETLMNQEGMARIQSLRLTNDFWRSSVRQILNAFPKSNRTEAEKLLLTVGQFNLWKNILKEVEHC